MNRFHILFLATGFSSMAVAGGDAANLESWKKIIDKASQGRAVITKTTQAPEGMTAIIIDSTKDQVSEGEVLAWGLPNGLMMIGNLYDREGNLVNARFKLAKHDLNESLSLILEKAVKDKPLPTSEGSGHEFFVFIDPACGHCKKTWSTLHGNIPEGVKVTWLPVNILSSPDGDARIAYASRGLVEMNEIMSNNASDGFKSFDPLKNTELQNAAAGLGMAVMSLSKRKATPMIVWRDTQGNQKIDYSSISAAWLAERK